MRRINLAIVAVVSTTLLLAACGDDEESDTGQAAAPTTTAATATSVAPTTTAVTTTIAPTTTAAAGTVLKASLTGAAEAPGPGDPDGTGTATLTLNPTKGEICYEVKVSKLDTPNGMHIHEAATGASGGIVVPFAPPTTGEGEAKACVPVDGALVRRIEGNPAGFYVNVHTSTFAPGAIRGQLTK
jgi:hypothetical protein